MSINLLPFSCPGQVGLVHPGRSGSASLSSQVCPRGVATFSHAHESVGSLNLLWPISAGLGHATNPFLANQQVVTICVHVLVPL